MRQVAGMDQQVRPAGERVDLCDGGWQCPHDVLVRLFREADVAVADLDEGERCVVVRRGCGVVAERARRQHAAVAQAPEYAGTDPGHAPEKSPAIDPVAGYVFFNSICHDWSPWLRSI